MKALIVIPTQSANVKENVKNSKNAEKDKKSFSLFVKNAKGKKRTAKINDENEKNVKEKKKSSNGKDKKHIGEVIALNLVNEKKISILHVGKSSTDIEQKEKSSKKTEKVKMKGEKVPKLNAHVDEKTLKEAHESLFQNEKIKSTIIKNVIWKERSDAKDKKALKINNNIDTNYKLPTNVKENEKMKVVIVKDEIGDKTSLNDTINEKDKRAAKNSDLNIHPIHSKNASKVVNEKANPHFEKVRNIQNGDRILKEIKAKKVSVNTDNGQKSNILNSSNGSDGIRTENQNSKIDSAPKDFRQNENQGNFQKRDFEDVFVKFTTQKNEVKQGEGMKELLKTHLHEVQLGSKKLSKDYEALPQLNRGENKKNVIKNDIRDEKPTANRISKQVITAILRELKAQKPPLKIEIRLNPPELGKITLEIREKAGKTSFFLNVENEKTKELMKNVLPVMINQLSNLNFNVVEIQMNGQQWLNDEAGQRRQRQDQREHKKEKNERDFTKEFKELRKEEV